MSQHPFYAGLDWATDHHDLCITDHSGEVLFTTRVDHTLQGLRALKRHLLRVTKAQPSQIFIALETNNGLLVDFLLKHKFQLFHLNPKQLEAFRSRYHLSGCKDDGKDAHILADTVRTDRRCYHPVLTKPALILQIRDCARDQVEIQGDKVRLSHRLKTELRRYFPQALKLSEDVTSLYVLRILEKCPTPSAARRCRASVFKTILKKHGAKKYSCGKEIKAILCEKQLEPAEGVEESASRAVRRLVKQLLTTLEVLTENKEILEDLLMRQAESEKEEGGVEMVKILRSFPGVGPMTAGTLLGEGWEALQCGDFEGLAALSGVAPVTRKTGRNEEKSHWSQGSITMRRKCNAFLRRAIQQWGRTGSRHGRWKEQYRVLRTKRHSAARVYRSLGASLLRMILGALKQGKVYDAKLGDKRRAAA